MSRRSAKNSVGRGPENSVPTIDNDDLLSGEKDCYQNTYKMKPDKVFLTEQIKATIRECLDCCLKGKIYSSDCAKSWAVELADEIKGKVKQQGYLRQFKIVCVVHIGQNLNQAVSIASRSLWDNKVDSFACENFRNDSIFAQASVFGVYFE